MTKPRGFGKPAKPKYVGDVDKIALQMVIARDWESLDLLRAEITELLGQDFANNTILNLLQALSERSGQKHLEWFTAMTQDPPRKFVNVKPNTPIQQEINETIKQQLQAGLIKISGFQDGCIFTTTT